MLKVLLAHPGTQYSYHTAYQLKKNGYLKYFCTGFAIPDTFIGRLLIKISPLLKKRFIRKISNIYIKNYPFLELDALIRIKLGLHYEDVFRKRNRVFQDRISMKYINDVDVVISYDTTSWILAKKAISLKKKFILDVSIAHPLYKEEIFKKIKNDFPLWGDSIPAKKEVYIDQELCEIKISDIIVVPSHFVKYTYVLNGVPEEKIRINPFGTDIEYFKCKLYFNKKSDDLVFLFFGSLNARKGVPLLLKVWEKLNKKSNAKLILAGFDSIPSSIQLPQNVKVLGKVDPEDRVNLYQNADVFVFPSFCEGFAQVQIEAAACGLPVIATFNSGGEEIVKEGKNGFIIDVNDISTLEKAIIYFLDNPEKIIEMGRCSRAIAESFTWESYGKRWKDILDEIS